MVKERTQKNDTPNTYPKCLYINLHLWTDFMLVALSIAHAIPSNRIISSYILSTVNECFILSLSINFASFSSSKCQCVEWETWCVVFVELFPLRCYQYRKFSTFKHAYLLINCNFSAKAFTVRLQESLSQKRFSINSRAKLECHQNHFVFFCAALNIKKMRTKRLWLV